MAKSARRSGKGKAPAASPVSASGASTPTSQSGPLPPFTQAPECLTPFLKLLSPEEVYLIHIDRSDVDLKKQTFIIPAITNVLIIALIALRVYMGRTMYPALFATVVGLASPVNDTASLTWTELASVIFRRALPVLFDYLLVVTFLPWPIRFFAGPIEWRRRIGFRSQEIIVRRSQPTVSQNLERNRWVREDEEMRDKIVAAVTPDRLLKTGYLLVDADWGLDYPAMIKAHELVGASSSTHKGSGASSHLPLDEFRTAVLVNTDSDGWIIWHVGDENTEEGRTRSKQRDQILDFKEKLTEMGHEALFFRWVELIQHESTQPGGFTAERQASAMVQAKQLFEEAGVDFNGFWQEVGGMEGFGDDVDAEVDAEVDVDKFAEQLD